MIMHGNGNAFKTNNEDDAVRDQFTCNTTDELWYLLKIGEGLSMLVITHYFTLVRKSFFWIRYVTCMTSYNAVPFCLLALATISTYDDDKLR